MSKSNSKDKKESSSKTKDKKDSSASKTKDKKEGKDEGKEKKRTEKKDTLESLEAELAKLGELIGNTEEQLKENQNQLIALVQKAYKSLHQEKSIATKPNSEGEAAKAEDDGVLSSDGLKQLAAAFSKAQNDETELVQTWLNGLEKQNELIQKIRIAVCDDAIAAASKKKNPYALGTHTSQLLNQTTLSSSDDVNINWKQFMANAAVDVNSFKKGWDSNKNAIGTASYCSKVYQTEYQNKFSVAVKKIDATKANMADVEYFKNNFSNLAQIRFPPLLNYVGLADDGKIVVTELAKFGSILADTNGKSSATFPFDRKVKIARGLAVALNYLHTYTTPIIHGRVKPTNVLLTSDLKVKLADYGRLPKLSATELVLAQNKPYLAPEILAGGEPSFAADVFSYGAVIYYLFFNVEPDSGFSKLKTNEAKLPKSLVSHIASCTDANPAKRPQFKEILQKIRPFETILAEFLKETRGEAADVWNQPVDKMSWNQFCLGWKRQFGSSPNQQQARLMKAIMGMDMDNDAVQIERTNFELFLKWFGPVNRETIPDIFKYLDTLVTSPTHAWFHGKISPHEAKESLRGKDAKKPLKDNYLVRLNTGTEDEKSDQPFIIVARVDTKTYEVAYNVNDFKEKFAGKPEDHKEFHLQAKLKSLQHPTQLTPYTARAAQAKFELVNKKANVHGGGYRTDQKALQQNAISINIGVEGVFSIGQ